MSAHYSWGSSKHNLIENAALNALEKIDPRGTNIVKVMFDVENIDMLAKKLSWRGRSSELGEYLNTWVYNIGLGAAQGYMRFQFDDLVLYILGPIRLVDEEEVSKEKDNRRHKILRYYENGILDGWQVAHGKYDAFIEQLKKLRELNISKIRTA